MYCHNCGETLPEGAVYCPKCGTRTVIGQSEPSSSSEEMKEAFTRMSQELEHAFVIASRELHTAFRTARDNIQKNVYREPVVCANCGEKNPFNAAYCAKCGKGLVGAQPAQTATPASETQGSPQ